MRTVIVSTDASFCALTKAGGWGAVVSVGGVSRTYSGVIRGCVSSCQAELLALTAGVSVAIDGLQKGDQILIESDSEYALDVMKKERRAFRSVNDQQFAAQTRRQVVRKGLTLAFIQVPAHSGDDTAAQRRNRTADALARAGMAIGRFETSV